MSDDFKHRIKALAADVGYVACGTTSAEPFPEYVRVLDELIRRFPQAAHLYDRMRYRVDPTRTTPWARSIVVCIRRYDKFELPAQPIGHIGRNYLADRRVEPCPDYSMPKAVTAGLKAMGLRVRRGGVPDRLAAVRAGVARIGKNTFAYHEACGSWLNIATWRVDAELTPDEPTWESPCPPGCRACMDRCPTAAIVDPLIMRLDRCIAYLTYRAPPPIDPDLWRAMGGWVYGCDACQDVCPLNKHTWETTERAAWLDSVADLLTPQALAEMDEATYRDVIHPLFWYIPADDVARWRRNAKRAVQCEGEAT